MRLLQITASVVWRGHEQQIEYYYDDFKARGIHQVLMCPTNNKELVKIAQKKNYNLVTLDFKSEYDLKWIKAIKTVIKKENISLILIHSGNAQTLCVIASILSRKKTPMVFFRTLIRKIDSNPLKKFKYNYKHIRKIICVSQAVVDIIKPNIKDPTRLSIVGSCTEMHNQLIPGKTGALLEELNLSPNTKIIANISAFVPFKDHYTFVKAAKIINGSMNNLAFILIGIGEKEDEIKAYVNEQGLSDVFHFLGFRTDIPLLFPEFDLFMFTSKLEPTGGVLLEAYSAHVPIVATNFAGIPEVVIDNVTGLLAEKENPQDFATKAINVLNDEILKEKLVKAGKKRLLENFTKDIITDKMYEELNLVAKKFS